MIRRAVTVVAAVALAALPAVAAAQERVNQTRPAPPDGVVQIENAAGSVRVIGWERAEVAVSGTRDGCAQPSGSQLTSDHLSGAVRRPEQQYREVRENPHGVHASSSGRGGQARR